LLKRVRRRYLALEIDAEKMLSSEELMDVVWGAVLRLYGEYGASRAGLTLIDYDAEKQFAVIRVAHTSLEMVRTALASIMRVGNVSVCVHVLRVSGTIKALYRKVNR
jgi:RNase P/RNase MRP subunit POP5